MGAHARAPKDARQARDVDGAGRTLLPGLIDTHVHLQFDGGPDFEKESTELTTAGFAAVKATVNAKRHLDAGVTTVRDLGGMGGASVDVARAVAAGLVRGRGSSRPGTRSPSPAATATTSPSRGDRRRRCDAPRGPRGDPSRRHHDQADRDRRRPHPGIPRASRRSRPRSSGGGAGGPPARPPGRGPRDRGRGDQGRRAGRRRLDRALQPAHAGDGPEMVARGTFRAPTICAIRGILDHPDDVPRTPSRRRRGSRTTRRRRTGPRSRPASGTCAGRTPGRRSTPTAAPRRRSCTWSIGGCGRSRRSAPPASGAELLRLTDTGTIEPGKRSDLLLVDGDPIDDPGALLGRKRVWIAGAPV